MLNLETIDKFLKRSFDEYNDNFKCINNIHQHFDINKLRDFISKLNELRVRCDLKKKSKYFYYEFKRIINILDSKVSEYIIVKNIHKKRKLSDTFCKNEVNFDILEEDIYSIFDILKLFKKIAESEILTKMECFCYDLSNSEEIKLIHDYISNSKSEINIFLYKLISINKSLLQIKIFMILGLNQEESFNLLKGILKTKYGNLNNSEGLLLPKHICNEDLIKIQKIINFAYVNHEKFNKILIKNNIDNFFSKVIYMYNNFQNN